MFTNSPTAAPVTETDPGVPDSERTAQALRLLDELTGILMDTARALGKEAQASETVRPGLGNELARVAKAVRQTLVLKDKIASGRLAAELKAHEARLARAAERTARITERRDAISDAVASVIQERGRERGDENEVIELLYELGDVLTDIPDTDIETQPIGALALKVCHTLNLPFDPDEFVHEDWAVEERELKPPGSPYAAGAKAWRTRGIIQPGERPAVRPRPSG